MKITEEMIEEFCKYNNINLLDVREEENGVYALIAGQRDCDKDEEYIINEDKFWPYKEHSEAKLYFHAGFLSLHWRQYLYLEKISKDPEYLRWYDHVNREELKVKREKQDQEYLDWFNGLNV